MRKYNPTHTKYYKQECVRKSLQPQSVPQHRQPQYLCHDKLLGLKNEFLQNKAAYNFKLTLPTIHK